MDDIGKEIEGLQAKDCNVEPMDSTSLKKRFPKIAAKTMEACLNVIDVFENALACQKQQTQKMKSQLDQMND